MQVRQRVVLGIAIVSVLGLFVPHPARAGVFNLMLTPFTTAAGPVQANAARLSSTLFFGLFGLEFFYTVYRAMFKAQFADATEGFVNLIVFFCVGSYIELNQIALTTWLQGWIGTTAGAFSTGNGAAQTPDGVFTLGWNLMVQIMQTSSGNPVTDIATVIPQFIAGCGVIIAFIVIAVEMLAMSVATQFLLALAGLAIGFIATRWTRPFAATFPRVAYATLLLLVTVNGVASVGTTVAADIVRTIATLDQGNGISGILAGYVTITGSGIVLALVALAIPSLVAFLGATSPLPGGAMVTAASAAAISYFTAQASKSSQGSGGGKNPVAQIEAATRTA